MKHPISPTSLLCTDGRTVLPRAVRAALGLKPGNKIAWLLLSDGRVMLRPKKRKLADLAGALTRDGQPSVTIDEMNF